MTYKSKNQRVNFEQYVSPERFSRHLHRRLSLLKRHSKRFERCILPAPEWLTNVLATCYHASTLTEEGRSLQFTLVLDSPMLKYRRGTLIHAIGDTKFEQPKPFTVSTLRRLAVAAEAGRSAIVYSILSAPNTDYQGQSVVGLMHLGSYAWDMIQPKMASLGPLAETLIIRVSGPGELIVSFGDAVIAKLQSGRVLRTNFDIWQSAQFESRIEPALEAYCIPSHWEKDRHIGDSPLLRKKVRQWLLGALDGITSQIQNLRHGGTILFSDIPIGRGHGWRPDGVSFSYWVEQGADVTSWIYTGAQRDVHLHYFRKKVLKDQRKKKVRHSLYHKMLAVEAEVNYSKGLVTDGVNRIAGLTAVDGAVFMNYQLRVFGWGGEILVPRTDSSLPKFRRVYGRAATPRGFIDFSQYGTRHRSAANFVGSYPGTCALIVSQDGGAKLLMNDDGNLIVWDEIVPSAWLG